MGSYRMAMRAANLLLLSSGGLVRHIEGVRAIWFIVIRLAKKKDSLKVRRLKRVGFFSGCQVFDTPVHDGHLLMNCLERGKLSYCLVVVISSSIVSAEVPTSTGKPLSVWDAIAVALQSSPDVSIASARIRESEAKLEEIRSACYPNISIDTGYLRSNAPSVVFGKTLDQRALDFGSVNFNDPDDINNFESGATLRYGLYSPGRSQQTKAVRHGVSAARFGKTAIENNLIDAVVKAYYTVLESDEMIGTAEGSLTTIEAELKDTRVRLQGGAALETDVLSLEVRQAAAKEDLIRSQNARQLALSSMANVMGLAVDAPIQLSGEEWEPRQLPVEFESGMKDAMSLRAELQRLRERLRSSRLHEEAARKAYLPRVDVMGRGYLDAS